MYREGERHIQLGTRQAKPMCKEEHALIYNMCTHAIAVQSEARNRPETMYLSYVREPKLQVPSFLRRTQLGPCMQPSTR